MCLMRRQYQTIIAAATAAVVISILPASAQYRAVADDGIAASPKVRQMLDEHARSAAMAQVTPAVGYRAVGTDGIAASPKLRAALDERSSYVAVAEPATAIAAAGYRATGQDGITASPKLREQLGGGSEQQFQIAPVK